jgi:tetratricopeptide (TPR) repeat protein
MQLCATLAEYWWFYGYVPENRRWYEQALSVDPGADSRERAAVMVALASDLDGSPAESVRLRMLEQALHMSQRLGDSGGMCDALTMLAFEHIWAGDADQAATVSEQSVRLARDAGDDLRLMFALEAHGHVEMLRNQPAQARELFVEAKRLAQRSGPEAAVVWYEICTAEALAGVGNGEEALACLEAVTANVARISTRRLSAKALRAYAHVYAVLGDHESAARLLGAHRAQYAQTGAIGDLESGDSWLRSTGLAAARHSLGVQRWEQALRDGASYTLEQALAQGQLAIGASIVPHQRT